MTEVATTGHSTEIEVLPPVRPAVADAIGQLMMHAQAMASAKQLGDALADTDLVPVTYKGKPGNAAAAILYGAELGLNPIQSLQQIFVVHGAPAIYARTAVALVKRQGLIVETVSSSDDAVTVRATDPRTGQVEECTWDIARAAKAGYTSNKKYQTDPQAMLYAKSAMECCRKIAPDVLLGIPYAREELDLEEVATQRVHSERARGVAALTNRVSTAPVDTSATDEAAAAADPAAAAPVSDNGMSPTVRKKWEKAMFAALGDGDCADRNDQLIVITALAGRSFFDIPEHRDGITDDELRSVVSTLADWKKEGRLGPAITDVITSYVEFESAGTDTDGDSAEDAPA